MHDENSVSDASCTELDRSKRIIETMKAVITSVESTDGVHKHRKHKKKKKRKKSKKDGSEVSPSVSAVREIETTLDQSLRFGDTSNGSPDSNEEQSNKLSTLWFHSPCLKKNTHNSDVKSESPIINAFDRMMRANSSKTPIESKRRSKDKKTKEIAVTEVKESKNLKESVSPLIQVNNKSPRSNEENQEAAVNLFEKLMQSQKNIQPVKPRSRGRPRKLNSTNTPKSNESIDEKPEKENLSINGRNRNTKEKKKDLTSNSKSKSKSTLKKNLNSSTSKEAVRESESNKTPLLLKRLRSDLVIADDENNISPSRPKRRCTQNVESYAIDLVSPDKLNNGKKVSISVEEKIKKNKEISPKNSIETVVIDILDDTPEKQDIKSKVNNKKLAPIFTAAERNEQKRQSMQARKDFLYSEISDSLKATINRQKSYEDNYLQCFTYPATSHVSQFTDIEVKELNELVNDAGNFNFKMADVKGVIQNFSDRMFCIGNFTSTAQIDTIDAPNSSPSRIKLVKYDKQTIRDIIKSLKMFCPTFPFTLCYNQLRGKNRLSPNKNTNVFTMKYRPRCTEEFIVNSTPVRELRKFLLTWQQDYINSEVDSDFEHGEGSNSSVSSMKQNNFIVLIGPPGSGKTIAVYALAEEMNFKILEMNSSERRKGQNLLQKLSEATKSHRVRTKAGKTKLIRSLFKNDSEEFDDQNSQDSNDEEIQKTIILMEDADIVMDEDEGFVNGIGQLIATSRRPIIMTTNSKNCAHLSKYVNRQCIEFNQPNTMRISCWLSTLSLVENTFILPNDFEQIFERNKKDIRKTLLELQIFTSTFGDHVIGDMSSPRGKGVLNKHNHKCFNKILTISNDMRPMCLVNNFDLTPKKIKMSLKRINIVSDDLCVYDMINGFNTTRKCDIFNEYNETISNLIRTKSIDDYTFNDSAETVTATETLRNNIYKDHLPSLNSLAHIQTEYEPVMRTICRAEKERASSERRSARFYHYLKPYNSDNDIFNTVCNYFIE